MIQQIEQRGDRVVHPIRPGSLIESLAVRLLLERFALAQAARDGLGFSGPLDALREAAGPHLAKKEPPSDEQRAFLVFQLAQVLGWAPPALRALTAPQWTQVVKEIEAFSGLERRRILHLGYEHRFV